jgi:hypothetical protein
MVSAGAATLQAPAATAAVCAGRPADRTLALLFMESNVVATATLAVEKGAVRRAFGASGGYFDLVFVNLKSIGGKAPSRISVRVFAKKQRGYVQPEQMERLAGEPVLVFLTRASDGEFYLVGQEKALQPATAAIIDAAEAERDRQWAILRAWKPDRTLPHYGEVHSLVAKLAAIPKPARGNNAAYDEAHARQDEIFARLETLGKSAVPAMAAHLDDRRPLAVEQISLVNHSSQAFEAMRHYGPEQVGDALAAILGQVAGISFDPIYNGGTDAQRRSAIAAWRIYSDDLLCYGG